MQLQCEMIRVRFVQVVVALLCSWGMVSSIGASAATEIVVRVDQGEDVGQNFGSVEGVQGSKSMVVCVGPERQRHLVGLAGGALVSEGA